MMLEFASGKFSDRFGSIFYASISLMAIATSHVTMPTEQYNQTIPINLRIFISHFWDEILTDYSVVIDFRWSIVVSSTDHVSFFNVIVFDFKNHSHSTHTVPSNEHHLQLSNGPKDTLLSFRVRGCWERFCGPESDTVFANTSVQSRPPLLMIIESNDVIFYHPDTEYRVTILNRTVAAICIITYDDSIFWVNNLTNEVVMDTADGASRTLTRLKNYVLSMSVDWIGRSLFMLERSGLCSHISKYDISHPLGKPTLVIMLDEIVNGTIHFFQLDPFQSTLYFSWSRPNDSISLARCHFSDGQKIERVLGLRNDQISNGNENCDCLQMDLHPTFALDNSRNEINNIISLYVVDVRTWRIWGSDKDGCHCHIIYDVSILQKSSSEDYPQFSLAVDHNHLYWIWRDSGDVLYSINKYTGSGFNKEFGVSSSVSFILGYNAVSLPDRECLMLSSNNRHHSIELVSATSTSLFLRFAVHFSWRQHCGSLSLPLVYYVLRYSEMTSRTVKIIEPIYETECILNYLKPFTTYSISVGASNYFVSLWKSYSLSSLFHFRTKAVPLAPVNFSVTVLTPNALAVKWCVPDDPLHSQMDIVYAVEWISENSSDSLSNETRRDKCFAKTICGLNESQSYGIRVLAYDSEKTVYTSTSWLVTKTFENPNRVHLLSAAEDSLHISWISPSDNSICQFTIEYAKIGEEKNDSLWLKHLVNNVTGSNIESFVEINGLESDQAYAVRTLVIYNSGELFTWPPINNVSSFKTLRQNKVSSTMIETLLVPLLVLLIFIFIVASVIIVVRKSRWKLNPFSESSLAVNGRNTDKSSHVLMSNLDSNYAINRAPVNGEISNSSLQNFCRDQVKFSRFICEIKNGDLFEGVIEDDFGSDAEKLPVILRTLNNEDLCEKEIEKQNKEILFMNCMKHKNIISMLGVCLLGEPQILVFELPNCGDLLSFIQSNKTFSVEVLLKFCLDIICGCQFFEEHQLVHRDLRTRNCFVFCQSPSSYNIKIGGFSLAKDIFRVDEGSGREIPIEWMAPEAIKDDLFTGMSDVWAYGVLLWEIFSKGMQPYSEISNSSNLLSFLTNGNRLKKPNLCPEIVFLLMLSCWRSSPFNRPSFNYIADQLEKATALINSNETNTGIS